MKDLEIYTTKGIPLDDAISEWAKSYGSIKSLALTEAQLTPSSIISEQTVVIAPLDQIPFRNETEVWTLTAILERKQVGVQIENVNWEEGHELWLPQGLKVYCPWPILATQIASIRDDLIISSDLDQVDARLSRSFEGTGKSNTRNIHPFELVPPAGFNSIGIVCAKNNLNVRKQLMSFHNETTATCTNVERKLAQRLSSEFLEVGVQCFQDQHNRYQLSVCTSNNSEIQRFKTIQNSWVGLHEATLNFFELSA